jgi:hypothetical protein
MLARHAIGQKPCPLRTKSRERVLKDAAAAEAIERMGNNPLNDDLADLFRAAENE